MIELRIDVNPSFAPRLSATARIVASPGTSLVVCQLADLFRKLPDSRHCARVVDRATWEQVIPPLAAEWIRDALSRTVPEPRNRAVGCDGTTYSLEIKFPRPVAYQWWSRPPTGWEHLAGIVETILSIARVPDVMQRAWAHD
jgi:hypothetical protein